MKTIFTIVDEDTDDVLAACDKRETAFEILKAKSQIQDWKTYEIKETELIESLDELVPVLYYKASCGLADTELSLKEERYFKPFDEPPDVEVSEVTIHGVDIKCEGRDLEKVCTTIRKFIASKRYEYEVAVRKVCNIIQPKLENGEAMTVDQICDESNITQDIVVKILLLLKKEGFLDITDPLTKVSPAVEKPKKELILPNKATGYTTSSGMTNVGFDKKGRLRKLQGQQASIPINKKKK